MDTTDNTVALDDESNEQQPLSDYSSLAGYIKEKFIRSEDSRLMLSSHLV